MNIFVGENLICAVQVMFDYTTVWNIVRFIKGSSRFSSLSKVLSTQY